MSELQKLFRLSQPSMSFRLKVRSADHIISKSAVVVIRGFLENGSEVLPSAGLPFSEKLGGHFEYLPEGSSTEWSKLAEFKFFDPISALRVDYFSWGKGNSASINWNKIDLRLHHSISNDPYSENMSIIGSFEVMPEEVY